MSGTSRVVPGFRLGLRRRLILWVMGPVTVVLGLSGAYDMHQAVVQLSVDRQRTIEAAVNRLVRVLPVAIGDLDTLAITNALMGELGDPQIAAIEVRIGARLLASVRQPGAPLDGERVERRLPGEGAEDLVQLQLIIDPRHLEQVRASVLHQSLLRILLIDALIGIAAMVVVTRITGPLSALTRAAEAMADGDLDQPVAVTARDEVGVLARGLDEMRSAIKRTIATIEQQNRDLDERVRERSRQLEAVQQELLDAANLAGKAEVATGVLHNIGNVLTGIFIELDSLRRSRDPLLVESTARMLAVLRDHDDDLSRLVAEDPRSESIGPLLGMILDGLLAADVRSREALDGIERRLGMIRDVLTVQQAHATGRHFLQPVDLRQEMEDMVLLHADGLARRHIRIERRYGPVPPALADRGKLGHIIANLLKNAQEALLGTPEDRRLLTIAIHADGDGRVVLEVGDNGVGIAPEHVDRIFSHGFTTKAQGHGFGLHYCANAAREMDATLTVSSPGIGRGATFVLTLAGVSHG